MSPKPACLIKHIEAFENGSLHGDLEYAITNLYRLVKAKPVRFSQNVWTECK